MSFSNLLTLQLAGRIAHGTDVFRLRSGTSGHVYALNVPSRFEGAAVELRRTTMRGGGAHDFGCVCGRCHIA
jgi:hypothetical protein